MFLFAKQNILDEFSIEESKQKISQAKIIKLASSNLSGIGESEWVIQERGMIRFNPRIWVTAIVKTPLSSWLSFFRIFFFFFHHILPFPTSRVWLHVITRFFSSQTSILFFETFFSNVAEKRLSINRHECSRSMNLFFFFFSFRIWDAFQVKTNDLKY